MDKSYFTKRDESDRLAAEELQRLMANGYENVTARIVARQNREACIAILDVDAQGWPAEALTDPPSWPFNRSAGRGEPFEAGR